MVIPLAFADRAVIAAGEDDHLEIVRHFRREIELPAAQRVDDKGGSLGAQYQLRGLE